MKSIICVFSCICILSFMLSGRGNDEAFAAGDNIQSDPDIVTDYRELDTAIADYSNLFESSITPRQDSSCQDCTQLFIDGKLQLSPEFFTTGTSWEDIPCDAPVNGVLGNDFKRIEVYIYPGATKTDSVTYSVRGRTKVKDNVRDFMGEIRIKKIYHIKFDDDFFDHSYRVIAEYSFREDPAQKGSGEFHGIYGADGYVEEDRPGVILVDDRLYIADGYENRSYVGTWRSYDNPALVKRCMWGDYRLPFRFDFDIGDGEIRVNPKYASPEWDRYMRFEEFETLEPGRLDSPSVYKNPWW